MPVISKAGLIPAQVILVVAKYVLKIKVCPPVKL